MGEVEVRAKRESWWEGMKTEMEARIGALSKIGVLERCVCVLGEGSKHQNSFVNSQHISPRCTFVKKDLGPDHIKSL